MNSRTGVLALWLCAVAAAALVVARATYITDLSAFLPAKPTPVQQLLVDQLRDGPASRLILIAVEQGGTNERTRVSLGLAKRLRLDRQFSSVENGEPVDAGPTQEFLLQHRYLLSDSVNAALFSSAGLRSAIEATIDDLTSPAGLMLKSLFPSDPTGEMLHIIDQLQRLPAPASRDGVWVSADGSRTLAVAQTAAAGSDTDAQERALGAIRAAFAAAVRESGGNADALRLRVSGPGVFAVAARAKIKQAAVRLSIVSSALVITLLFAAYRSLPALALGLLPVATGAVVGIAAVALGFGAVHGITLGFGITLIGESVDYSIYFFVQSRRRLEHDGTASSSWQRRWWPTIRLGMLTSVCGFASLLPSGFPGLAQLGLYSISGLIAAALVTRFVLPALLPREFAIHDVAPLGHWVARRLQPVRQLPGPGVVALSVALAVIALFVLYRHHGTLWNRELAALSPISPDEQRYDEQLRADLGTADVRALVIVAGPSLDAVLTSAEEAARALEPLVDDKTIAGFDSPANYLPSLTTQTARRDSLPAPAELRDNLRRATADLPVQSDRLQPFLDDVEAARHAPLITAQDLQGTSLRTGFDALILHAQNRWNALLPLHAAGTGATSGALQAIDTARVAAALRAAHLDEARVLDLKQESDALYAGYLSEAIHLSSAGFALLIVLLGVALRAGVRVARVLAPLGLSVLSVAAVLASSGVQLTILHLVGLLLIVAVGSNYALFFDRQSTLHDSGSEALTLASLVIANASTVIAFGLLSFSRVPVLVALGTTVAPGAFLALLFSAALSRPDPRQP
jgi:predicted exporter